MLVAGEGVDQVAMAAAEIAGVAKVRVAQDVALASQSAEVLADLLAALAEPYSHIVAGSTSVGRDVIPRLAAKLDLMPVTDVIGDPRAQPVRAADLCRQRDRDGGVGPEQASADGAGVGVPAGGDGATRRRSSRMPRGR